MTNGGRVDGNAVVDLSGKRKVGSFLLVIVIIVVLLVGPFAFPGIMVCQVLLTLW